MHFSDLGLSPKLLQAIADVGYETPTPIQEESIPWVLAGRDVLGIAQTGTGKTGGFTLPMIEILSRGRAKARMPRSLILAPTRELAHQVAENFTLYGKYHPLSMALLIGGESFGEQEKALDRGVDVLIATPGRLLDMFERGRIILRDVKILVIDEADRMLDMGFIPDVEKIVSLLPPLRQTLFFSATMDAQIRRLTDAFLQNPKEVRIDRQTTTAETVRQHLVTIDPHAKRHALRTILRQEDVRNAFIFCNRKRDVGILHRSLRRHGFKAVQLHGDMPQSERTATLSSFKNGDVPLMVCSDVAARGLDVADVSHVFNFDVPIHSEDYVHRIGRTGRAGRDGCAYTLATPEDARYVAAIEKLIKKTIPAFALETLEAVTATNAGANPPKKKTHPKDRTGNKTPGEENWNAAKMTHSDVDPVHSTAQEKAAHPHAPGERDRGDRRGSRRRGHAERTPADSVPVMEYPEDALAFGGYTPAFMLAPLTGSEVRALRRKDVPGPVKAAVEKARAATEETAAKEDLPTNKKPPRRRTRKPQAASSSPLQEQENAVVLVPPPAPADAAPTEEIPVPKRSRAPRRRSPPPKSSPEAQPAETPAKIEETPAFPASKKKRSLKKTSLPEPTAAPEVGVSPKATEETLSPAKPKRTRRRAAAAKEPEAERQEPQKASGTKAAKKKALP